MNVSTTESCKTRAKLSNISWEGNLCPWSLLGLSLKSLLKTIHSFTRLQGKSASLSSTRPFSERGSRSYRSHCRIHCTWVIGAAWHPPEFVPLFHFHGWLAFCVLRIRWPIIHSVIHQLIVRNAHGMNLSRVYLCVRFLFGRAVIRIVTADDWLVLWKLWLILSFHLFLLFLLSFLCTLFQKF